MSDLLSGKRILIVEDQYLLADDACAILNAEDAAIVGPVRSVADAMLALPFGVDAAVLDVALTDGAVYPVAEALEARGTPFLFMTGYAPDIIPVRWADIAILTKPVSSQRLVEAVSSLLANG